jgi:hypothetical protein
MEEVNIKQEEPKIRFNMKQTAKGEKYYDITVRGDNIEDIKKLFAEAEEYARNMGCIGLTQLGE